MSNKILTWKCKVCGKEINSIYPAQMAYNKAIHLDRHKRRGK